MYFPPVKPTTQLPQRRRISICVGIIVSAIVAAYFSAAISATWEKSATFDEVAFVTGGVSYWTKNDYRLCPNCNNWPRRWVSLPALWTNSTFPTTEQAAWRSADVWELADQFLYRMGNDADDLVRRGRIMTAILGGGLALTVFFWARQLFGNASGLFSLALFAASPSMLAQGARHRGHDGRAILALSVWGFWQALHRAGIANVLGSALAVSGLLLSKYSGVLILPMALSLMAVRIVAGRKLIVSLRGTHELMNRASQLGATIVILLIHVAMAWLLIWASYGFRNSPFRAVSGQDTPPPPTWPTELNIEGPTGACHPFRTRSRIVAARLPLWLRPHVAAYATTQFIL